MQKTKLIIIGGHGDGLVAVSVAEAMQGQGMAYDFLGFLNDHHAIGEMIAGYPVLGKPSEWKAFEGACFHIALHKAKEMPARINKIYALNIPRERLVNLIHPSVSLAKSVKLGRGCLITQNVAIQAQARLGDNVSIRAGANIGHDAVLEDFTYIGANAVICGCAKVSLGAHIGPNATVEDKLIVGKHSIIGSNTVVMKNTEEAGIYLGNPMRKIRNLQIQEAEC